MSQIYKNLAGGGGTVVETLTGNTGAPVPPTGNNINVVGTGTITVTGNPGTSTLTISTTAPSVDLHTARYIVASSLVGTGANYTSITSAIAAAVASGVNSTIFLQPGTYIESFNLPGGINLAAYNGDQTTPNVIIIGNITMNTAGASSISSIRLEASGAPFLTVSGSAGSIVYLLNCFLFCSNNNGIIYSSSSVGSAIVIKNCISSFGTTGIELYNMTSPGVIEILNHTDDGGANSAWNNSSGNVGISYSGINSPLSSSGTGGLSLFQDIINSSVTPLTFNGSGASSCSFCDITSGSATAVSVGALATLGFIYNDVSSSNSTPITGSGTINYSGIVFSGNSAINTTTQGAFIQQIGAPAYKYVSTAISYQVLATDSIVGVTDNSAARTVTMPNSGMTKGQVWCIKDEAGTAGSAHAITISGNGVNIDGASTYVMSTNYESVDLYFNGTQFFIR